MGFSLPKINLPKINLPKLDVGGAVKNVTSQVTDKLKNVAGDITKTLSQDAMGKLADKGKDLLGKIDQKFKPPQLNTEFLKKFNLGALKLDKGNLLENLQKFNGKINIADLGKGIKLNLPSIQERFGGFKAELAQLQSLVQQLGGQATGVAQQAATSAQNLIGGDPSTWSPVNAQGINVTQLVMNDVTHGFGPITEQGLTKAIDKKQGEIAKLKNLLASGKWMPPGPVAEEAQLAKLQGEVKILSDMKARMFPAKPTPSPAIDVLKEKAALQTDVQILKGLGINLGNNPSLQSVDAATHGVLAARDLAMRTMSVTPPFSPQHIRAQMQMTIANFELGVLKDARGHLEKLQSAKPPDVINPKPPSLDQLNNMIRDTTAQRDAQAALMQVARFTPEGYAQAKAKLDGLNAKLDGLNKLKAELYPEAHKPTGNARLDALYAAHPDGKIPAGELDNAINQQQAALQAEIDKVPPGMIGMTLQRAQTLGKLTHDLNELKDLKAKLYPPGTQPSPTLPTKPSADGLIHDGRIGPGHGEAFNPSGLTPSQERLLVGMKHLGASIEDITAEYQRLMARNAIPGQAPSGPANIPTGVGNLGPQQLAVLQTLGPISGQLSQEQLSKLKAAGFPDNMISALNAAAQAQANTGTGSTTGAATGGTTTTSTGSTVTAGSIPRDGGSLADQASNIMHNFNTGGLSQSEISDLKAAGATDQQIAMQNFQKKQMQLQELMEFMSNMLKKEHELKQALISNMR